MSETPHHHVESAKARSVLDKFIALPAAWQTVLLDELQSFMFLATELRFPLSESANKILSRTVLLRLSGLDILPETPIVDRAPLQQSKFLTLEEGSILLLLNEVTTVPSFQELQHYVNDFLALTEIVPDKERDQRAGYLPTE